MRKLSTVLLTLVPIITAAADLPSLAFPEQKVELPSLSLAEIGKTHPPGIISGAGALLRSISPWVVPVDRLISRMPIITVKSEVDPKMVKAPDPSVDYKLIVKAPGVASAK